jgi:hypothetical protein
MPNAPHSTKILGMEQRHSGPCPTCGNKRMIRRTKDVNSPFLGWIECAADACAYEASLEDFRETLTT